MVSLVSPFRDARARARSIVEGHGAFIEVHVATPVEVCTARDPKGLYARALAGEISGVTGIDDPYEEPSHSELVVQTEAGDPRRDRGCRA